MSEESVTVDIYDGYEIPVYNHDGIKRLYAGTPFENLGPYKLDLYGTCAMGPNGDRILASKLRDMADEEDAEFIELFSRMKYIPNGQLKNFLVTCRAFYGVGDVAHIAVVGSKSQEGSGAWHKYLAYFLSFGRKEVCIDFFDPNEVDAEWKHVMNGCEVRLRWISEAVNPEDVSAYDAVSSDVWNYGTKTQWGVPGAQIISLKGSEGDYVPYLHPYETRYFSQAPSSFKVHCPCITCKSCAESSRSWRDFVVLRTLSARLGNPYRCRGAQWVYDNNTLHDIRQEIVSGGAVEKLPSNFRYIMSLSVEEAVAVTQSHFVKGTVIKRLDPRTTESTYVRQHMSGLEGKSIAFAGVDPAILGNIRCIVNPKPVSGKSHDVLFTSNVVSWSTNYLASQVFCPERPDIVEKVMIGWKWTGSMLNEFYEYRQLHDSMKVVRVKDVPRGFVKTLVVSRKQMYLRPFDGFNPVYAEGNQFCTYDSDRHMDPRCTFSRKFFYFDSFVDKFTKAGPLFNLLTLPHIKTFDFFYSPQFTYRQKTVVRVMKVAGPTTYRGSCPADYFREYGVRLMRDGGYAPILVPFEPDDVFYLS